VELGVWVRGQGECELERLGGCRVYAVRDRLIGC
jgi:hypothetical protein